MKWSAIVFVCCFAPCLAILGIDFSDRIDNSTVKCLLDSGYNFGTVRAWHSYGEFDPNAVDALRDMNAGPLNQTDVYLFPCATMDAASQVHSLIADLKDAGAKWGRIWISIETNPSSGCGWPFDHTRNCHYLTDLINAITGKLEKAGVFSNEFAWGSIMGQSCTSGHKLPLWYQHRDDEPNFDDFQAFGGWLVPTMKQFSSDMVCALNADFNYVATIPGGRRAA